MTARDYFARQSIGWKLPAMLGALLLIVTGALSLASYFQVRGSARTLAEQRLHDVTGQIAGLLVVSVRAIALRTDSLAREPAIHQWFVSRGAREDPVAIGALESAGPRDTTLIAFQLLDADGSLALAAGPQGNSVPTPSADELARVDSMRVGALRMMGDTVIYPVFSPVREGARRIGYLVQWRRTGTGARGDDAFTQLIGSGATLVFGMPGGTWASTHGTVSAPPITAADTGQTLRYRRDRGGEVLAYSAPVRGTPWMVAVEFPRGVVMAPVNLYLVRIAIISILLCAAGVIAASMFSRRIIGPLHRLTRAAGTMNASESSPRVPVEGEDELAQLSSAFNVMAERIDEQVAARRESEEQWRRLFDANPHPMWVFDLETLRFLAVNTAAITQYGFSHDEFLQLTVRDIRPESALPALEDDLKGSSGAEHVNIRRHRRKDGSELDVEVGWHALNFAGHRAMLVTAQNITARQTLEAQFRQAQKMEAVGRLAGGVAHDFNNALAVISTYTELLADGEPPERQAAHLDAIQRAARHAQGLTRQLLAFSRRQVLQPVNFNPNTAVLGIEPMLRRVIGEDVELVTQLESDVGQVRADPGQFEQVLMNLTVNARDAMPEGGRLTISTAKADLDPTSARLHGLPAEGHYVMLTVADTGNGMDAETRARIFEPFFTTKEEGKGTGLGLATVYGIVNQSGGHITVYSEQGSGSTFRVYLPRVDGNGQRASGAHAPEASPRGAETILLVEDDAEVREMVAEVLGLQGYQVLVAATAADAIAVAERRTASIDMVLSDVVMPKMNGPSLVARLREIRPGLKALMISGYTGDAILPRGIDAAQMPFLEKPFTVKSLARKVREVLDGAGQNGAQTP